MSEELLKQAQDKLYLAKETFVKYSKLHAEKKTHSGIDKALRNNLLACEMELGLEAIKALADEVRGKKWQDISTAPKDGTVIMIPYSDLSGMQLVRWGTYNNDDTKEGWFDADWSDEAVVRDDDIWLSFPDLPQPPKEG